MRFSRAPKYLPQTLIAIALYVIEGLIFRTFANVKVEGARLDLSHIPWPLWGTNGTAIGALFWLVATIAMIKYLGSENRIKKSLTAVSRRYLLIGVSIGAYVVGFVVGGYFESGEFGLQVLTAVMFSLVYLTVFPTGWPLVIGSALSAFYAYPAHKPLTYDEIAWGREMGEPTGGKQDE